MALYTLKQPSDQIFTTPLKSSLINDFANPSWSQRLLLYRSYRVRKFEDLARTVLPQYCSGTEQIFTVKGSFDIATTRVSKHLSSNYVQDGLWGHVYIGSRHVVATRDCCGLNGEALYLLYGHAPCRRAHTEQDCWFQMASSRVQK